MIATTTTKEENYEESYTTSCTCRCCSCRFQENSNNWWKMRRKMRKSSVNRNRHQHSIEDEIENEKNEHNPVPQDCNHGSDPLSISPSTPAKSEPINLASTNNNRNMLICDYDETELFSQKLARFNIFGGGCGLKIKSKLLPKSTMPPNSSFVTFMNFLVIFITLFLLTNSSSPVMVNAFPTNDCDWSGSGTPENVVQAIYLRCQQGQILWERPRGGLRVNISPPKYFKVLDQPFRLCLETRLGSNFQVFLEQTSEGGEVTGDVERRKLLPFITPRKKSSTCYRIASPSATLYVESQNQPEEEKGLATPATNFGNPISSKDAYQVKISYEIEELKVPQEGYSDDECRPCSDAEVVQLYCVADVVARGEILSVGPSLKRKGMDNLHIRSNLLIHQNHAVFQNLKPGNKNLQKFLTQETSSFDQDSPIKMKQKSDKKLTFGGVVSHPSKCAAQSGPGQFLWLIKLSFGRPKIGCVVYWDRWVSLANEAEKSGSANCPLTYQ